MFSMTNSLEYKGSESENGHLENDHRAAWGNRPLGSYKHGLESLNPPVSSGSLPK